MRPPEQLALERIAGWGNALATALGAAVPHLARLSGDLQRAWPDDRGREYAERLALLRRELDRQAAASERLARSATRIAHDLAAASEGMAVGWPSSTPPRHGPRLGGTEAYRVEDDRGVRIAQLPDPGSPPG